jgi:Zn-dependent metalloprotease
MLLSWSKISRWGTRISLFFALILAPLFSSNFNRVAGQEQNHGFRIGYHKETGKVNFIGVDPAKEFKLPNENLYSSLAIERPMAYLNHFGQMLGLSNPRQELMEISQLKEAAGRFSTRYQQVYNGVPILAGELVVNLRGDRSLLSISGEISPDLSLSTVPKVSPGQAQRIAIVEVSKAYGLPEPELVASPPELWIFDERLLLPSARPAELVWKIGVRGVNRLDIEELVLVNAQSGGTSLHFNTVDQSWISLVNLLDGEGFDNTQPHSTNQSIEASLASDASNLFLPYVVYPAGDWAYAVGIGDFNNDSRLDVAMTGYTGVVMEMKLFIFHQGEDGVMEGPVEYPARSRPETLTVGDFNNDGLDDIAVGSFDWPWLDVFLQNLEGSLNPAVSYEVGDRTHSIKSGDVNNDGRDDIVLAYFGEDYIDVLYQNSVSGFASPVRYSSATGQDVEVDIGDINNDGLLDVIKSNETASDPNDIVSVYLQNPDGTLNGPGGLDPGGPCEGIAIGDLTGDGLEDIIITDISARPGNWLIVTEQDAGGGFNAPVEYGTYTDPGPIETGDVSLDGQQDVVVAHDGSGMVSVMVQLPDGTLSDYRIFPVPNNTHYSQQGVGIGDVTGDDLPDIVLATYGFGLVVLEHAPVLSPSTGPTGNRETYDANNETMLPGTIYCNQSQPYCTGGFDPHVDAAHYYAGDTHAFYKDHHDRNSIDNNDIVIVSTTHYDMDYQATFWSPSEQQVVYGDGYGYPLADDVVAHELTHGITQHTSNLFYCYQSGAINESFSDLWGEFIDQTNGAGDDSLPVKWLIGEDVEGLAAVRNMANPPAFEDPDKMTSQYYYTGSSDYGQFGDNGGVHTNSGVNNKAIYLATDGGDFNGYHVDGLGINKVAAIYYEVQTNLLTSGADYLDLYHALYQGCLNLIGGDEGIVSSDCDEVRKATNAVEMNLEPILGYNPEADLCPETQDIINIFYDDLEQGASNWIFRAESGASSWGWESGNSKSGTGMLWGKDENGLSDSYAEMNVDISLPTGKTTYLFFAHSFGFEDPNYDGGWLEYSIDGGSNWYDATTLFDSGFDYTGPIYDPGPIEGANPNRGHIAFVGDSHGYVSSRYDLTQIAGENVRFRWRLSTDAYVYDLGWFVDDVRVYGCSGSPLLLYLPIIANNE